MFKSTMAPEEALVRLQNMKITDGKVDPGQGYEYCLRVLFGFIVQKVEEQPSYASGSIVPDIREALEVFETL